MQYFDFVLAWWFNVGVQIFLCISGYLYGQKRISDVPGYYSKRFKKILLPYYITVIIATIVTLIVSRESFDLSSFLGALLLRKTIKGGTHLWFVPYILLCYVITPILGEFVCKIVNKKKFWIYCIGTVTVLSIFFGLFDKYFNAAWMSCYVIGYWLGVNKNRELVNEKSLLALFCIIAVIGNGTQVYLDYVCRVEFKGAFGKLYSYACNYNHTFLGIFLFIGMKKVFDRIDLRVARKALILSDNYSYEIYLVHQFLIFGPLSLMDATIYTSINIIFVLLVTVALTVGLRRLSNWCVTAVRHFDNVEVD